MIKRGKGHIATVGSLTGMLGTYNCTDYSGSKYAIIGFHESLATELKVKHLNSKMLCFTPVTILDWNSLDRNGLSIYL